jgi:hypothetical protein
MSFPISVTKATVAAGCRCDNAGHNPHGKMPGNSRPSTELRFP